MSRINLPTVVVGNEFAFPPATSRVAAAPAKLSQSAIAIPVSTQPHAETIKVAIDDLEADSPHGKQPRFKRLLDLVHRHATIVFALLFLLVGATAIVAGGDYLAAHDKTVIQANTPATVNRPLLAGLNLTVPIGEADARLQAIINQPASLTVGPQTIPVSPDTISSWLRVVKDPNKGVAYISIRPAAISSSLTDKASKYAKDPVAQVSVNHGAGDEVIVAGRNGARLTNPDSLKIQAQQVAKSVMDAKGLQFSTPLETVPFQALTPAAFSKLIEVDVVTKQMYLYDNGNITYSYPISAGAPATPTPIGQFKIFGKYASQDMEGYNANGTKYFQPHVHWINYFKPGGYAIHGVYWHGPEWFGANNSSHGCVGLPDYQAKTVYDWAPIGTTVITHY